MFSAVVYQERKTTGDWYPHVVGVGRSNKREAEVWSGLKEQDNFKHVLAVYKTYDEVVHVAKLFATAFSIEVKQKPKEDLDER